MINVDANLFRLVYTTVSTEETRYYLNGVHIEPHPTAGAILVSTDGHRATIAYDHSGVCDRHVIIQLPKGALSRCKPVKDAQLRLLVDPVAGSATINEVVESRDPAVEPTLKSLATEHGVLIDGTFPDWRRILPSKEEKPAKVKPTFFNPHYLKEWAAIGIEITKTIGGSGAIRVSLTDGASPSVIRWVGCDSIFGVQMPIRRPDIGFLPPFVGGGAKPDRKPVPRQRPQVRS